MRVFLSLALAHGLLLFAVASCCAQTELGSADDLTVFGVDGTAPDPDVEIKGFTVFGSTQAAYPGAVVGPGHVVVNGALAVSSGAYFVGNSTFTNAGKIFINDGAAGQLLRRHTAGHLEWTDSAALGDNLGNHTATQALDLAGFNIVNASSIAVASGKPGLTVSTSVFISTGALAIGEKTFFTEWNGDSWWSANAKLENGGWNRIDTGKTAFAWSMLGNNNYPYETEQGVGLWVAQSAANPINPVYGAVGGWELGLTLMSNKNLVVGGFGIELDGNGIQPYMRVVHNNSLGTINSGIVTNLFADYSGRENNAQPSWYFGRVNDSFQVRRLAGNASIADANLKPLMVISSSGVVLGSATYTGAQLAAVEVISTGTAANIYAQIWRDGTGAIVSSMTSLGVLYPKQIASGDNLGNHTATLALQMGAFGINSSSAVSAGYFQIGGSTMVALLPGAGGIAYGVFAGTSTQAGGLRNLHVGNYSGAGTTTGDDNVYIGYESGYHNKTGSWNFFLGTRSGMKATGNDNVFIGSDSGYSQTTAGGNIFIGSSAGYNNVDGFQDVFIGYNSGYRNNNGAYNTYVGYQSGYYNVYGHRNSVFGHEAAIGSTDGDMGDNSVFGYQAGKSLSSGDYNVLMGSLAGDGLTSGGGNIIIGYNQDAPSATTSNHINIGGVYYGDTSAGTAQIKKVAVQAADSGITLTSADFGKTITVNNAAASTINLPGVTGADIGSTIIVVKLGAGKVTIDAPLGAYIADSASGGTIYNSAVSPAYAAITLRLATSTTWIPISGHGAWITTN